MRVWIPWHIPRQLGIQHTGKKINAQSRENSPKFLKYHSIQLPFMIRIAVSWQQVILHISATWYMNCTQPNTSGYTPAPNPVGQQVACYRLATSHLINISYSFHIIRFKLNEDIRQFGKNMVRQVYTTYGSLTSIWRTPCSRLHRPWDFHEP